MKKILGFTLAEIMIVLVVIGVLSAILLPVAINSTPNEDVMKFKKGHNALLSTIRELVNSDKYYLDGDLGIRANGVPVDSATFFCETLADVINAKSVTCSDVDEGVDNAHIHIATVNGVDNTESSKNVLDERCQKYKKNEIITNDGVGFYQVSPVHHFYCNYTDGNRLFGNAGHWNDTVEYDEDGNLVDYTADSSFDLIYKVFCMDIDGIDNGEDPFGYGIRADGKVLFGTRAEQWLQKSIQEKE